jgi:hypothetical protein
MAARPEHFGIRALRDTLKLALRRFGLRAVDIREHATPRVSRCSTSTAQAARKTRQAHREGEMKMKMTKYAGSAFIGLDDLQDGPFRGTIAAIAPGSYDKPVITFGSGPKFSLNKTNVGILIEEYGDESDDWIGEKVELYAGTVPFNGEDQPSVVVRPLPRAPGEKKPPPPKPKNSSGGDMDDEVPF